MGGKDGKRAVLVEAENRPAFIQPVPRRGKRRGLTGQRNAKSEGKAQGREKRMTHISDSLNSRIKGILCPNPTDRGAAALTAGQAPSCTGADVRDMGRQIQHARLIPEGQFH